MQLEGFSPGAFLHPLLMDSHSPHACPTPRVYTFIITSSIGCFTSLVFGFSNRSDWNSQSSVAGARLSLGENHFPTNSLTWRELLTGLTTYLFNHFRLSFSRVTAIATGKTVVNTQNSNSHTLDIARLSKKHPTTTRHNQSRNYVVATTNHYDTTWLW